MDELENIQSKIYVIRGHRVMLDRDLANAYGVETKALNQAVKRNIKRFEGEDYMFQLTKEECLRSQIVTLNEAQGKHLKYMPYAFTMLGTAMLSSVLRSETAIQTNRMIMRAFVAYRNLAEIPIAATYLELKKKSKPFALRSMRSLLIRTTSMKALAPNWMLSAPPLQSYSLQGRKMRP